MLASEVETYLDLHQHSWDKELLAEAIQLHSSYETDEFTPKFRKAQTLVAYVLNLKLPQPAFEAVCSIFLHALGMDWAKYREQLYCGDEPE